MIQTYDLLDTGTVLYQLSYQPTESWSHPEECKCMYERPYIWTSEKDMKTWLIIAVNQFN